MMDILTSFILLLVIMDPVVSLAALLSLTKNKGATERRDIAIKGISVATTVFVIFALCGGIILETLGLTIDSFKAAGGVILMILGIQGALGLAFPKDKENLSEVAVIIGTPLISGPATIATTMILVNDFGLLTTLIAGLCALGVISVVLLLAEDIRKLIGRSTLQVLSTMVGIVLIGWGIQFVVTGVLAIL